MNDSPVEEVGFSCDVANPRSNVLLGTIGAILGALVGCVLWVIIYQFGFIATLAGIVIVMAAHKGYTLLSKRKDVKAVVISVIVSIIMLFLAHYFCWGLDIYNYYKVEIDLTIFDALSFAHIIAFSPENIGSFVGDLLMGYIFMIAGSFTFISQAVKDSRKKKSDENQPSM